MSDKELLKRTATDYFELAKTESDGLYHGALLGMRSVFTLTDQTEIEQFVNGLLDQLKSSTVG